MLNVVHVEVVPHAEQRYSTCGDWQVLPHGLSIKVSDTGDEVSNMLVAIHELVEAVLCRTAGVTELSVDQFDMGHPELDEPGEDEGAPYHLQHVTAEIVERLVAQAAGKDWREHSRAVDALYEEAA